MGEGFRNSSPLSRLIRSRLMNGAACASRRSSLCAAQRRSVLVPLDARLSFAVSGQRQVPSTSRGNSRGSWWLPREIGGVDGRPMVEAKMKREREREDREIGKYLLVPIHRVMIQLHRKYFIKLFDTNYDWITYCV